MRLPTLTERQRDLCGAGPVDGGNNREPARPAPTPELPLGGRTIFPDYRVVADYGSSGGPALGILGEGSPDAAAEAVARRAQKYTSFGRRVQPAMELITTVALASPGPDGTYSSRGDPEAVQRYLDAAHRHHQLLILDFQPCRGDYLSEVTRFEKFLLDPSVGVALDPEWNVGPDEVPGQVIGSSLASRINAVSAYPVGTDPGQQPAGETVRGTPIQDQLATRPRQHRAATGPGYRAARGRLRDPSHQDHGI